MTQKGAFGSKSSYSFLTKEAISIIVQLTILICFSRPIVVFPRCPSIWSGSFSESAFVVVVVLFFSRSSNVSFPKKSATNHFALSRQNSNQNDAQPLMTVCTPTLRRYFYKLWSKMFLGGDTKRRFNQ